MTSIRIYLQSSIKNNKEERRSGATGTGVSQKDLQSGKKRKKALEKLVEKVRAHCKLELGAVRSWEVTRAKLSKQRSWYTSVASQEVVLR